MSRYVDTPIDVLPTSSRPRCADAERVLHSPLPKAPFAPPHTARQAPPFPSRSASRASSSPFTDGTQTISAARDDRRRFRAMRRVLIEQEAGGRGHLHTSQLEEWKDLRVAAVQERLAVSRAGSQGGGCATTARPPDPTRGAPLLEIFYESEVRRVARRGERAASRDASLRRHAQQMDELRADVAGLRRALEEAQRRERAVVDAAAAHLARLEAETARNAEAGRLLRRAAAEMAAMREALTVSERRCQEAEAIMTQQREQQTQQQQKWEQQTQQEQKWEQQTQQQQKWEQQTQQEQKWEQQTQQEQKWEQQTQQEQKWEQQTQQEQERHQQEQIEHEQKRPENGRGPLISPPGAVAAAAAAVSAATDALLCARDGASRGAASVSADSARRVLSDCAAALSAALGAVHRVLPHAARAAAHSEPHVVWQLAAGLERDGASLSMVRRELREALALRRNGANVSSWLVRDAVVVALAGALAEDVPRLVQLLAPTHSAGGKAFVENDTYAVRGSGSRRLRLDGRCERNGRSCLSPAPSQSAAPPLRHRFGCAAGRLEVTRDGTRLRRLLLPGVVDIMAASALGECEHSGAARFAFTVRVGAPGDGVLVGLADRYLPLEGFGHAYNSLKYGGCYYVHLRRASLYCPAQGIVDAPYEGFRVAASGGAGRAGEEITCVLDTAAQTIRYLRDGIDCGVAFEHVNLSRALFPAFEVHPRGCTIDFV